MFQINLSIILGIVAALASLIGSLIVLTRKKVTDKFLFYFISIGAGFILAATVFDMIPEALKLSEFAGFYILGGFFLIHFFEHVFSEHFHFGEETHSDAINKKTAWAIMVAFLVHTFLDGVAISSGFSVSAIVGIIIFGAVVLHKIPDGLTIASVMLASGRTKKGAFAASLILALATVAGSIWAAAFSQFSSVFLGISAGVFMHIAATDLIPEVVKKRSILYSLLLLLGVLMYSVSEILLIKLGIG
ncbi:ZIP family metal transporter [bacterium]|nr:ZIP family metal transporter [bacterium]